MRKITIIRIMFLKINFNRKQNKDSIWRIISIINMIDDNSLKNSNNCTFLLLPLFLIFIIQNLNHENQILKILLKI